MKQHTKKIELLFNESVMCKEVRRLTDQLIEEFKKSMIEDIKTNFRKAKEKLAVV